MFVVVAAVRVKVHAQMKHDVFTTSMACVGMPKDMACARVDILRQERVPHLFIVAAELDSLPHVLWRVSPFDRLDQEVALACAQHATMG